MCFPHKMWVKEWQRYHEKHHDHIKCKKKYLVERIVTPVCYIYDDLDDHRCYVCRNRKTDSLTVRGWNAYHICVDGGLIRFGCRNYMGDYRFPQGRCDSMVFDRDDLWFVEFKLNATTTQDKQLWADLKDGMSQLSGFLYNLRYKMAKKRTPLERYYSLNHQHCTVCMKEYPKMTVSRNNEFERFRLKTGLKLQQLMEIPEQKL